MKARCQVRLNEDRKFISYCSYCGDPIFEDEGYICVNTLYYHYDRDNPYLNCYFPEDFKEEE